MEKNDKIYFILITLFILIGQTAAFSQVNVVDNQTKKYNVILKDGSSVQGTIISENAEEITLATENIGTVKIKRDKIKTMVLLDQKNFKKGKYWFPNPNYSRYFISPGMQLKKGDGYYQNVDLALNTVSYGLTDNFSIGAGVELFSTLSGHPIFIIMPKLGFKVADSFWIGGGILYINSFESLGSFGGIGIAYGSATVGNEKSNITGGIGFGYFDTEWSGRPIITLSGMTRISRRLALVTENWFVPENTIFSYGVRFIGEKISVDIGLINSKEIVKTFAFGVPAFIDFVYKF